MICGKTETGDQLIEIIFITLQIDFPELWEGRGATYYKIDIQGLGIGDFQFEYSVDSQFFEMFENTPVSKGELNCKVLLV